jgi:hypothetical protein
MFWIFGLGFLLYGVSNGEGFICVLGVLALLIGYFIDETDRYSTAVAEWQQRHEKVDAELRRRYGD